MSLTINKEAYTKLIEQDLKVLDKNCKNSLELDHIKLVLCNSIDMHYPEKQPICKDHNTCCFPKDEDSLVICLQSKGCFQVDIK